MPDPINTWHYLDMCHPDSGWHILPWNDKNTTNNYISHHINSVRSSVYLMSVSGCFILPKNSSVAVCHSISFILSSKWLDWLEKIFAARWIWISFKHTKTINYSIYYLIICNSISFILSSEWLFYRQIILNVESLKSRVWWLMMLNTANC